jgi:hypothetical protein
MSAKTKARRPRTQQSRTTQDRRRKAPQMDLFASGRSGGLIGPPAWAELPAEVQGALVRLIAQLILEHADKSRTAAMAEADHDL